MKFENYTMDNGMQVVVNTASSLSKDNGRLIADGNYSFEIRNLDSLGKIKETEVVCDEASITGNGYVYAGTLLALLRMSWDTTNYATWLGTRSSGGKPWDHKVGTYFPGTTEGFTTWTSRQGVIPVSTPVRIRTTLDDYVRLYFNDTLIAEKENDIDTYPKSENWNRFQINSGGRSGSRCVISSIKVTYE